MFVQGQKDSGIKTDTFSGTTDSQGTLTIYNGGDRVLLGVQIDTWTSGFSVVASTCFNRDTPSITKLLRIMLQFVSNGQVVPVANNTISGTYWYIEA